MERRGGELGGGEERRRGVVSAGCVEKESERWRAGGGRPRGAPRRHILPWLDPRDLPPGSAVDREDTPGPETTDPGQGAADLGFTGAVPSGKKPMEPPAGGMTRRATEQEGSSR